MTDINQVFPERDPVCAGCGKVIDPQFAHWTTDYRQVCTLCAKKPSWRAKLKKPLGK